MSYKRVQKFGPCAGMEIRPNRNLSGQLCELAQLITFSVWNQTVHAHDQ